MRSMTVFAAALLVLFACKPQDDYGMLAGTILDPQGMPAPGARISTVPATDTTSSDAAGKFAIDHVPVGDYLLKVTRSACLPWTQSVTVRAGETTHVDPTMAVSRRIVSGEALATGCRCAIARRMILYALKDSLGDSLMHVEYHATSDTLGDGWEAFITPSGEDRRLFYNDTFYKGCWFYPDGRTEQQNEGAYRQVFDSLVQVPSPVQLDLSAVRNGSQVDITVTLTAVDSIAPGTGVGLGVYEVGPIHYVNGMGDTTYLRDLVLAFQFTDTIAMAPDEVRTIQRSIAFPDTTSPLKPPFHVVNKDDLGAYVIIQDLGSKQIHQAAQKKL